MHKPITTPNVASRRTLLRRSLALAVTAPALASILRVSPAFADDDGEDGNNGNGNNQDDRKPRPAPVTQRVNVFTSDLSTVAQSAASGDFNSSNPGTDPLADGSVRLVHSRGSADSGRLQVALRGAVANVSYDVFFWPVVAAKPREALGTIGPTNKDGNLSALTPNALAGLNRVGVFVIVRHDGTDANKDEFISSMGG